MKKLLSISMLLFATICLFSCSDDDEGVKTIEVTITTTPPSLNNLKIKYLTAKFTNRNTNVNQIKEDITTATFNEVLPEGYYDVTIIGTATYTVGGNEVEVPIKGFKEGINFTGANYTSVIDLFLAGTSGDFIIEELSLAGTLKPDGKTYRGDAYFKITNNSDTILYADGLCIIESKLVTTTKLDHNPNIIATDLTIQALYAIPGNNNTKNYPIEPGKSLIIADQAQNHTEANPNSIDLSKADFEWYDESTSSSTTDTDNPNVPNLEKIYCYTMSIWLPTQQGNRSFALGRLGVDKETYLSDYRYEYSYPNAAGSTTTNKEYRFPNEWIVDAVNTSIKDNFAWVVTAPSLDMGWTYWQETSSDKTAKGTSNRRKILSKNANGLNVYQDTNNSSEDFDIRTTPSLK